MGPHWFYHPAMTTVWVVTDVIWVVPEIFFGRRRPGKDAQLADRGSKAVVIGALNLGVFLAFLATFMAPGLSLQTPWKTVFAIGIAVWYLGIFFRWYSIRVLGRFFTTDVAISQGQHVVKRGPYRWVRHPSYLGGLIAAIGFGMTMTNWLAMLLPAGCLAASYAYRIPIEERALVQGLGPDYSSYMQRTWRLIPFVF
jgi:protein-S-isoprenylcysteine O-methyltransferase Ste14